MVDNFALALSHGLLAFALLRLAVRADVDADPPPAEPEAPAPAKPRLPELRIDA